MEGVCKLEGLHVDSTAVHQVNETQMQSRESTVEGPSKVFVKLKFCLISPNLKWISSFCKLKLTECGGWGWSQVAKICTIAIRRLSVRDERECKI